MKYLASVLACLVLSANSVQAQVTEEEAVQLGYVAQQWIDEGLNPEWPEHWPRMVEIAHGYGYMWELDMNTAYVAVYGSLTFKGIVLVRQAGNCASLDAKYDASIRMKRAFEWIAIMYASAAVLTAATGALAPLAVTLAAGALVGQVAAWGADGWAIHFQSQKRAYNCAKGEEVPAWLKPARTQQARISSSFVLRWSYGA